MLSFISGEANEFDARLKLPDVFCLFVLHFQLFRTTDKKFLKALWDVHKKVPAVPLIFNVLFFPDQFIITRLPVLARNIERKAQETVKLSKQNYLMQHNQNLSKTVDVQGASSIPINTTGNERTSFTVVLCCAANGLKLQPMLIFKRKTLPKENFPKCVEIRANENGWMNEQIMLSWLQTIWRKRKHSFFRPKAFLIMDSMKSHTSVLMVGMSDGEKNYTKTGKLKQASYENVSRWVLKAWNDVAETTVKNAFRKCNIIVKNDSDDESLLSSDSDVLGEDLINLLISESDESDFEGFFNC
ncbi:WASH complex subunit 4 [Trichonephila clavipes]|nr:WASH complex subunit 4 [Trichonephila clavipes]